MKQKRLFIISLLLLLLTGCGTSEEETYAEYLYDFCAHGYGIQIGGYEDDLTHTLTEFFHTQGMEYPEISEIICKEKIYTDCSDYDNFKKSITAINQELGTHRIRLVVLEDFVYCDCEYTILKLDKLLADKLFSSWSSENFEIYL